MGINRGERENRQPIRFDPGQTAPIPTQPQPSRKRYPLDVPFLRSSYFQFSVAGIAAVFLLATIAVAALGREAGSSGTIPSDVRIAGVEVGGMNVDEAREAVSANLASYVEHPITLTYEGHTWTPTMDELGAEINLNRSLSDAQFSRSYWGNFTHHLTGNDTTEVPLYLRIDDQKFTAYVDGVAGEIDREPTVPKLAMQGSSLVIAEAENGVRVQRTNLRSEVRTELQTLEASTVPVPVEAIQPTATDIDQAALTRMIEDSLGGPMTITFEGQAWTLEPETIASFIQLSEVDGTIDLGFKETEFVAHLNSLITGVDRPAQNATIAWGGQSVVATSPSQTGVEKDIPALIPLLKDAIVNGQAQVELPVNFARPTIDSENLAELGITGLVAQGESHFWNSAPSRANNIRVAAGYLDGTVVAPGQEFSFNQAIGEISVERGYQEGYVIQAEETVPGIGGGVCQVSTTMFRAAYFSGMPITERNPHAYIVGYYEEGGWPLGFDAAIYQPTADFKFVNTTNSYMLIHTYVDAETIYVNIYGPETGYEVEMGEAVIQNRTDPPPEVEVVDESLAPGERRQVEWAKPGMDITLPRIVRKDGEVVREDYFYSSFQPWGDRYLVGPEPEKPPEQEAPADEADTQEPSGETIDEETTGESEEDPSNEPAEDASQ